MRNVNNALATVFLVIGFAITLWTVAFLEQIPGVPLPGQGGQGSGIAIAFLLALFRWLALSAAFVFLLINGTLNGWARYAILRVLFVIVGITLLEICMFPVHIASVDKTAPPYFRTIFKCLVILFPLCVMVGGRLGSRALFLLGTAGALGAAVWPTPSYTPPPPDHTSIEYLLINLDPAADRKVLLSQLEQHPGWFKKASRAISDTNLNAAVLVTLKPQMLSEDMQERCWKTVLWQFALLKPMRDSGQQGWMHPDVARVAWTVQGLVSLPGPVRDRHHADFLLIRDLVAFYNDPKLPDLSQSDWAPLAAM